MGGTPHAQEHDTPSRILLELIGIYFLPGQAGAGVDEMPAFHPQGSHRD